MSTAVATQNDKSAPAGSLALLAETWSQGQIALIRRTIAPNATYDELGLLAMVCQRTGLDPFTRQIYGIKRGDKFTIQTGIDGYRLLAARTGALAGIEDAEYDTEDAEHPAWARVTVYRLIAGQRVPFTAKARWSEYKPERGAQMWEKMPYLMLGKCAEALALRKAFPAELSGVYTAEEMSQADTEPVTYVEAEPTTKATPATSQPRAATPKPASNGSTNGALNWGKLRLDARNKRDIKSQGQWEDALERVFGEGVRDTAGLTAEHYAQMRRYIETGELPAPQDETVVDADPAASDPHDLARLDLSNGRH